MLLRKQQQHPPVFVFPPYHEVFLYNLVLSLILTVSRTNTNADAFVLTATGISRNAIKRSWSSSPSFPWLSKKNNKQRLSLLSDASISSQSHHDYRDDHDSPDNAVVPLPCFDLQADLTESSYTQAMAADLRPLATDLRRAYDSLFRDPREPAGERFVFDPWVVRCGDGLKKTNHDDDDHDDDNGGKATARTPAEEEAADRQIQYSLKRAQLSQILNNDDLYDDMIDTLSVLGQSVGCSCLTPPWISVYTHGDLQNFHTDTAHGPLAFVFSITMDHHYGTEFTGGETMLLQPHVLDYWRGYDSTLAVEAPSLLRFIPPRFGQCLAFDPRVPHGVTQVKSNSNDPRNCRVVIHGWFAEPETQLFGFGGGLDDNTDLKETILESLNRSVDPILEALGEADEIGRVLGFLSIRLDFRNNGELLRIATVCDTLVADPEDFRGIIGQDMEGRDVYEDPVSDVKLTILENLKSLELPLLSSTSSEDDDSEDEEEDDDDEDEDEEEDEDDEDNSVYGSIVVPFVFS